MKKLFALPLAAVVALGACADSNSLAGPGDANFELVGGHGTTVVDPDIMIYARFGFTLGSATSVDQYVGPGMNEEGQEHGWCVSGRWRNPAGKFAGASPHSHCVRGAGASQQDVVEMEAISGKHWVRETGSGREVEKLIFGNEGLPTELSVVYLRAAGANPEQTRGNGVIVGHALRNGVQSGKFVFSLDQFDVLNKNLLDGECYVGDADPENDPEGIRFCLAYEAEIDGVQTLTGQATAYYFEDVNADHSDLTTADRVVTGFVYWEER